jgi:hypothetical protein
MTPNETEAFAALRMHVAHLHNAAAMALAHFEREISDDPTMAQSDFGDAYRACKAALEQSEPAVKDLLAEADRDAKMTVSLKACEELLRSTSAKYDEAQGRMAEIEGRLFQLLGDRIP